MIINKWSNILDGILPNESIAEDLQIDCKSSATNLDVRNSSRSTLGSGCANMLFKGFIT